MSTISSNYSSMSAYMPPRPDPSKMASKLFSQLDTSNKGYLEKSDLQSAFDQLSSNNTNSTTVDQLFSKLDGDSDGKVTQDEMTSGIKQLTEQLDSQFNQMRMRASGMPPPPPPPKNDSGFTQDELQSQLDEIGSSDATRSSLISKVVNNFAAADSNSDGKVSFQEAMAYDQSSQSTSSTSTSDASSSSSTAQTSTDAQLFKQIMELMRAYGQQNQQSENGISQLSRLLSVSA